MSATMTMQPRSVRQIGTPRTQRVNIRALLADLWTIQDVMRLFRKSEQTISIWIVREQLPVIRIPGARRPTLRFDRDEVLEWARNKGKRIFLDPQKD
jgi:hypothetical protein